MNPALLKVSVSRVLSESLYRLGYQLQLVAISSEMSWKKTYGILHEFDSLNKEVEVKGADPIELHGGLEMHRTKSHVAVLITVCVSLVYLFDLWRFIWGGKVED